MGDLLERMLSGKVAYWRCELLKEGLVGDVAHQTRGFIAEKGLHDIGHGEVTH